MCCEVIFQPYVLFVTAKGHLLAGVLVRGVHLTPMAPILACPSYIVVCKACQAVIFIAGCLDDLKLQLRVSFMYG